MLRKGIKGKKENQHNRTKVVATILFLLAVLYSYYFSSSFLSGHHVPKYDDDPKQHHHTEEHTQQMIHKYMNGPMVDVPPDLSPVVPNLPSVTITAAAPIDVKGIHRGIYGGEGDKAHLGGFTDLDPAGITVEVWKYLLGNIGVKSLLDVGCGKGISTSWFLLQGIDAVCVEGSHDAVTKSVFPTLGISQKAIPTIVPNYEQQQQQGDGPGGRRIVEHDFSRGPWWPSDKSYDAVWAVEFLEHVGRNYMKNYITVFKKAAIVFVTHSTWGGWHHVEVHDDAWWIAKYTSYGLIYNSEYTEKIRMLASAGHVKRSMMVFINPHIMSKPEHEHLFAEFGCFFDYGKPNYNCGSHPRERVNKGISVLPDSYLPIPFNEEGHNKWQGMIDNITAKMEEEKQKKEEEKAQI